MGILWLKYVRAGKIDSITRAKNNLPATGIIKVVCSDTPSFKVEYTVIKGSVHEDIQKSFKGTNTKKIQEELAKLSI